MLFPPHFVERFTGKIEVSAPLRPALENFVHHPVLHFPITHVHHLAIEAGLLPYFPGELFTPMGSAFFYGFVAVFEQQLMQVDLYGAYFGTVAAKRGSIAEVLPLPELL